MLPGDTRPRLAGREPTSSQAQDEGAPGPVRTANRPTPVPYGREGLSFDRRTRTISGQIASGVWTAW
jgi:hypothetical protein